MTDWRATFTRQASTSGYSKKEITFQSKPRVLIRFSDMKIDARAFLASIS